MARANAEDKDQWLALWSEWQRHMSGEVPADVSERTWRLSLDTKNHLAILLACVAGGEAVGFAHVSFAPFAWTGGDIAFLQDLFVRDGQRGKRVGEALVAAVYEEADRRGATQVYWMVDERDEGLQRFYARHGIRTPYLRYMRRPWPW